MAIYADLLSIVGKEQEIRNAQGINSLRAVETEQIQKQSQLADESRRAIREAQLAQDAADAANKTTTPQTAPDGSPVAALDPTAQAAANAARDYKAYSAEAAALRRSGAADPKMLADAELRATQAMQNGFHYQNLMWDKQREKAKNLASLAGAVNPDGSNVGNVVARIDEVVPSWSKKADLDRDLMGNVVWGKHTQDALASTQKAGATANEQITAQQQQARIKFDERKLELEKQKETRREKEAVQRDSLARDGLALRERQQSRLEKNDTRAKPTPIKEADVKDEGARIKQDNPTLTDADAKAAARDFLSKTNELIQQGKSREDAQFEAQNWINAKIETGVAGKPYVSHFFGADEPGQEKVPGKYNRAKTVGEAAGPPTPAEMPMPEIAGKLNKAGVGFSVDATAGVFNFPDAKTANKGIDMLPTGATFIGPDGKTYKKTT
jgi:hypothetical protein